MFTLEMQKKDEMQKKEKNYYTTDIFIQALILKNTMLNSPQDSRDKNSMNTYFDY